MDRAQRDTRVRVDAFTGLAAGSPSATRARSEFDQINAWADDASRAYIDVLDKHPLEAANPGRHPATTVDLPATAAAVAAFHQIVPALLTCEANFTRYTERFASELARVERELAAVPSRVVTAREALAAARAELARLPELGLVSRAATEAWGNAETAAALLDAGAASLGVAGMLRQAQQVTALAQRAQALAAEAPRRRLDLGHRLTSLRTRVSAAENRVGMVDDQLSELRRRYVEGCWADLTSTGATVAGALRAARAHLREAEELADAHDWESATEQVPLITVAVAQAEQAERAVIDRRRELAEVESDPQPRIDVARFAVRDAQRLVMGGRDVVASGEQSYIAQLDALAARLDTVRGRLQGTHPDYRSFLRELADVVEQARALVVRVREQRGNS